MRKWFTLLFSSRSKLRERLCDRGEHVHMWYFWRENFGGMASAAGAQPAPFYIGKCWVSYCVVCKSAYEIDVSTPRPKGWRKWRRCKRS